MISVNELAIFIANTFFLSVCSNRLIEKYVMHEKRDNVFFLRQTQEPCCASRHPEVIADFHCPHRLPPSWVSKAFLAPVRDAG